MAATVSGSKTVTKTIAPHLSAAALTTLLETPVENLTIAQLETLVDATRRVSSGQEPTKTLGAIFV